MSPRSEQPSLTLPAAGRYVLEPAATKVTFATTHVFGAPVHGSFALVSGEVVVAENPADTVAEVSIDAKSIDTGLRIRDAQLRAKRFLDADRRPILTFRSTALSRGREAWTLSGMLAARGSVSSAAVVISSIVPTAAGFTAHATAQVDTRDLGLPSIRGVLGRFLACTFEVGAHLKST